MLRGVKARKKEVETRLEWKCGVRVRSQGSECRESVVQSPARLRRPGGRCLESQQCVTGLGVTSSSGAHGAGQAHLAAAAGIT